jgi:uncharacterized protein with PQ loop repeat
LCIVNLCQLHKTCSLHSLYWIGYFSYLFYGLNVNVVQRKLHGIGSTAIAAVAFVGLLPFALVILFYTGYFNLPLSENKYFISTLSSSVLGILAPQLHQYCFICW